MRPHTAPFVAPSVRLSDRRHFNTIGFVFLRDVILSPLIPDSYTLRQIKRRVSLSLTSYNATFSV